MLDIFINYYIYNKHYMKQVLQMQKRDGES